MFIKVYSHGYGFLISSYCLLFLAFVLCRNIFSIIICEKKSKKKTTSHVISGTIPIYPPHLRLIFANSLDPEMSGLIPIQTVSRSGRIPESIRI